MLRLFARIGLSLLCILWMTGVPQRVLAQQSASFQLQESSEGDGGDSDEIASGSIEGEAPTPPPPPPPPPVSDSQGATTPGSTAQTTPSIGDGGGTSRTAARVKTQSTGKATATPAKTAPAVRVKKPTAQTKPATAKPAAPANKPSLFKPFNNGTFVPRLLPSYEKIGGKDLSFFDATTSSECEVASGMHGAATENRMSGLSALMFASVAGHILIVRRKNISKSWRRHTKKRRRQALRCLILLIAGLSLTGLTFGLVSHAYAANESTLDQRSYKGTLRDSNGNAVTSPVNIRFSYWKSPDYVPTDSTGTGAINAAAANYLHWYEVLTITPASNGYFSVSLGKVNPLPNLSQLGEGVLKSLSLQVEVKLTTTPDTGYELLDADVNDPLVDRSRTLPVPLARNSDFLDQHDTGTGAADIPVLNNNGQLLFSTIPGGTTIDFFTIDTDNTSGTFIELKFGSALGKKLSYNVLLNKFIFNASLEVQGNLTVTGLINGVDLTSFQSVTDSLKASSGGGLNLNVTGGGYRLRGQIINYGGGTIGMAPNSTNFVFFGSGGLQKSTTGFPTDESSINIAQVVTSAGAILTVTDRRITQNDDREKNVQALYAPLFEKAVYQGDGSDNVGQLVDSHDNISMRNYYLWTSTRPTMQDYDIILRVPVSQDFVRWQRDGVTNPISINYRSTSGDPANNKLDITAFDTNGTPVSFSGSTTGLNSTSWATANLEFNGNPTWTPGQEFILRLKVSAKNSFQIHVGSIKMNYVDLDK